MASDGVAAVKGVPSRSAFFTPTSSASLLDEFENQASSLSALSRSIVFPHSQCTLSSQRTSKELLSCSNRSPTLQRLHDAVYSPKVEAVFRSTQPCVVASQCDTGMVLNSDPADISSTLCTRHALTNCGARSRCTASAAARTSDAVEARDVPCFPFSSTITKGGLSVATIRRETKPEGSGEGECSSIIRRTDLPKMVPLMGTPTKAQPAKDPKGVDASDVAAPTEEPPTRISSMGKSTEYPSKCTRSSVDASIDTKDWGSKLLHQIPTFRHPRDFCPGSSAAPFPRSFSQDQTDARSTSAHNEASTSLRRLEKCVSAASTVCTVNSDPLHDEGLERRRDTLVCKQHQSPNHGGSGYSAEKKNEMTECNPEGGPRLHVRRSSEGQSVFCTGTACEAPIDGEESPQRVHLHMAAGHCFSPKLPPTVPRASTGETTAAEVTLRQASLQWSLVSPVQYETNGVLPIRDSRVRPSVGAVIKQDSDQNVHFATFPKKGTGTQLGRCIISAPRRHHGAVPSGGNGALSSAGHRGPSASNLKCSLTSKTSAEMSRPRMRGLYAECTDNNLSDEAAAREKTALRITPTLKNIRRVLKPPFPVALTQLFTYRNASVETYYEENRQPRRICEAKHRHSSHVRKARRCTECADCVSSSTTLETNATAPVDSRSQLASPARYVVHSHPFQQPPTSDSVIPWDRSTASSSSGTKTTSTRHQQAASLPSSNNLLLLSKRSSKPSALTPLKGEEVVKSFGDNLSTFERIEILDYEEVWYWGARRMKHPDEVQKSSESNFGFDDARGDYLAILGDHICYRFEMMTPLGRGSFGQVFRAFDHKKKEQVALKIVRNKNHFHVQGRVEIRVLQELIHHDPENKANVIHMKEHFLFRNHLMITFELLSMNVYDFLKQNSFKGLSSLAVRSIAIQLLQALRLLRKQRIVHCDLKPENIALKNVYKSGIKVIDFGSSCREGEMPYSYIQSRFYRSPEVILGLTYNCAIDMWSLGCVLAELQTGQPLFPGENETDQINCIMEVLGPPPDYLISQSPKRDAFFKENGEPKISISPHGNKRKVSSRNLPSVLRSDDLQFVDFIRGCLQWDPARRMAPDEAMQHRWIKEFKFLRQRKQLALK